MKEPIKPLAPVIKIFSQQIYNNLLNNLSIHNSHKI